MARPLRVDVGGIVYHVLNRSVGGMTLFDAREDYAAFEKVLDQAQEHHPMRVLSYCIMPNHWHLVLWPEKDGQLSNYMQWLTVTHVRRWHAHRQSTGAGPIYQGRFRSFPIQQDRHFLIVSRYVERNALRANLVRQAEEWRWSTLWHRVHQTPLPWLLDRTRWPVETDDDWLGFVNRAETQAELDSLRNSVRRGAPFGSKVWQHQTAGRLKLASTLHPPWRPRKSRSRIGRRDRESATKKGS